MNIMRPPEHFGELIKDANFSGTKESIQEPNATITDIVYYILKCIYILAREVYILKQRIQ